MAAIQNVRQVDDKIRIQTMLVSCTDKRGLVSNAGMACEAYPEEGLIGVVVRLNPGVRIISTGNTYEVIKNAGYDVIEISDYTGVPEMKTGLVKSLHPKIHAGILGHVHTPDDLEFMRSQQIDPIDCVVVNFYDLREMINRGESFEAIRQAIDVGGPTLCHGSRKSFLSTAIVADPGEYDDFIRHVAGNAGATDLKFRFALAQKASAHYQKLMELVNDFLQNASYDSVVESYDLI